MKVRITTDKTSITWSVDLFAVLKCRGALLRLLERVTEHIDKMCSGVRTEKNRSAHLGTTRCGART